jgi:single-strand DNA-binding protein
VQRLCEGITCFNGVGKSVAEYVTKGATVMVTGRIHYTKWTDKNGTDRYDCEIIADQVDFIAKAKEAATTEPKKRRSK